VIFPKRGLYLAFLQTRLIFERCHTMASAVAINQPLVLTQGEERVFYNNVAVNVTAAIAVAFAAVTIYRQKLDGLYGKTYLSLTIGLGLCLAAEITWTYFDRIGNRHTFSLSC
jgi:hypothetical protein